MTAYRCLYRGHDGRLHHKDMVANKQETVRRIMTLNPLVHHIVAVYPVNPYLPTQPENSNGKPD